MKGQFKYRLGTDGCDGMGAHDKYSDTASVISLRG